MHEAQALYRSSAFANRALPRAAHARRALLRAQPLARFDPFHQARGGALVLERDREHSPAAGQHAGAPAMRSTGQSPPFTSTSGRQAAISASGVSSSNQVTASTARERGDQGEAVFERIDRPLGAFAQAPGGGIAVQRDEQRRAQVARAGEVGDVAAMQDVEHAVGEHQRPRRAHRSSARAAGRRILPSNGAAGFTCASGRPAIADLAQSKILHHLDARRRCCARARPRRRPPAR